MNRLLAAILLLALAVVLPGCGAGSTQDAKSDSDPFMARKQSAPAQAPGGSGATAMEAARSTASVPQAPQAAQAKAGAAPTSAPMPQGLDRKIIMNAELDLRVKNVEDALSAISQAVRMAGGYVQEARQQGTREQGRTIHISVRVPSGSYFDFVSQAATLAEEVVNRREWTSDVTAEYLDLEARIKTREVHLAQLQKLYDKGGTIKEMMELEQEIARVTADLESLKGRFRFLSNQVEFSTVTVRLYEPGAPVPVRSPKTVLERMKLGFTDSWHGVVNFTGDLVVFVVSAIPILVYLALFGLLGYPFLRYLIRRFRRRPEE